MEFDEREDTESVLREFLQTELGFIDANNIEIQRVHRLGKKMVNPGRSSPDFLDIKTVRNFYH